MASKSVPSKTSQLPLALTVAGTGEARCGAERRLKKPSERPLDNLPAMRVSHMEEGPHNAIRGHTPSENNTLSFAQS
jgi:hypothetical protein